LHPHPVNPIGLIFFCAAPLFFFGASFITAVRDPRARSWLPHAPFRQAMACFVSGLDPGHRAFSSCSFRFSFRTDACRHRVAPVASRRRCVAISCSPRWSHRTRNAPFYLPVDTQPTGFEPVPECLRPSKSSAGPSPGRRCRRRQQRSQPVRRADFRRAAPIKWFAYAGAVPPVTSSVGRCAGFPRRSRVLTHILVGRRGA